jgi:AraC-like DNA-binding protein
MPLQRLGELFCRLPVFSTTDVGKMKETKALSLINAEQISVPNAEGFKAWGNAYSFRNIALGYSYVSTGANIVIPAVDYARLQIPLLGKATTTIDGHTVAIYGNHFCVVSPHQSSRLGCEGPHSRLTLRIKASALEQRLAALIGTKPKTSLIFSPELSLDRPYVAGLLQLVHVFALQLDPTSVSLSRPALEELEDAIVITFLDATQHCYSHLLGGDARAASPREVRDAEEYIEANWNKPIRIEDLVAHTGVSARLLFRSFKKSRGSSPLRLAKMVRLKHAKEMLAAGGPNTSVTAVAFKCGFGNLGHFANDYREAFDELPSETLARAHDLRR